METDDSLSFEMLQSDLGLGPEAAEVWAAGWEQSQSTFPTAGLDWLLPSQVDAWCDEIGLSDEARGHAVGALALFRDVPVLRRLAWHCHQLLHESPGMLNARVREWPLLPIAIHPKAEMFLIYPFLAGIPALRQVYRERNIPEDVLYETLGDVEIWLREHRSRYGRWGFSEHKWLIQHFSANLFLLARLQFQPGVYRYDFRTYRQIQTRRVCVLAPDGLAFSADGLCSPDGCSPDWIARLRETSTAVEGNPVSPLGRALRDSVRLPLSEWELVLQRGDSVINIHIPAGGSMAHAACGESFRRAAAFFPEHFPELDPHAFVCTSWLFDPQLEACLPKKSNIVRLMRELYLVPAPGSTGAQTIQRVFGHGVDWRTGSRETSLQRAVASHLENGGVWRQGSFLLFSEDLNWGGEVYRAML